MAHEEVKLFVKQTYPSREISFPEASKVCRLVFPWLQNTNNLLEPICKSKKRVSR